MPSIACNVAGVQLKSPIIMASGTFGFGREYSAYYDLNKLGGIVSKGLTMQPRRGNRGTRIWETASGLLNSVGLENPGIEAFLADELDAMTAWEAAAIVNLGGSCLQDYVQGAERILDASRQRTQDGKRGVDMLELNISCPNVRAGGIQFGVDTAAARDIVRGVRRAAAGLPLAVKLSPNARDIAEMARMCEAEGADAISLINTIPAMKIDIRRRRSVFDNLYAGLSGPAIKPIALRLVHQAAKAVSVPVIGIGGIATAEDILEFVMAGAAAVQVGTANFMNLRAGAVLADRLAAVMDNEGIASLDEIRGIV
jgi:dihydroorotate dehydrogenase (NAD+) catalytic subunit